ncbi:peptidylprolyl isomerase [Neomicrococcus aestuarii]|uniref:peptidylprolyl isomerase n=1 Tax=Neomicrococcus aestuarii TaxID=556325 RepID=A0A7W8TS31_9MICC|nr:FKBP-type peptidyl-prolyl cis-trans isomerase [Neomicrococcus aestuarii]MBB5511887.1 peptidylprolyl isomerase [Neomicrococcus aestuarii]
MRKVLASAVLIGMLSLTACGSQEMQSSGNPTPLNSIEISAEANATTAPKVTFDTPLVATEAGAKVVRNGDGAEIKEGQLVSYKLAGYSTEDGSEIGNTFDQSAQQIELSEMLKTADPEIYEVLVGAKVGSWIAYTRPVESTTTESTESAEASASASESASGSAEASGSGSASASASASDGAAASSSAPAQATQVLIMEVTAVQDAPKKLSEDEVKKLSEEGALPTVNEDSKGTPTITIPEGKDAPADLAVEVLEEGTGDVVATETSTVTANYVGVQWSNGEIFDSSYDRGEATSFGLDQVIPGWTQGLTGLTKGSKVLLTIPSSMAYGESGTSGRPTGPLVFYVEITDVK